MSTALIKTEYPTILNHQQVCRLCLNQELLEDIFSQKDLNLLISAYLSIVVSKNDSISRSICFRCLARLREFRDFQLRCLEVQDILQNESTPVVKQEVLDEAEEEEPPPEADATKLKPANLQPTVVIPVHGDRKRFLVVQGVLQSEPSSEEVLDDTVEADAELTSAAEENLQPIRVAVEYGNRTANPTLQLGTNRKKRQPDSTACSISDEMIPQSFMEDHQDKHKGFQHFKCIYDCKNISFDSQQAMRHHYRIMHNSEKHKCDICEKSFQSKKMLYIHKRATHTSKTLVCSICSKAFLNLSKLKEHMDTHDPNRVRKFPCPVCNFAFDKYSSMKRHMRAHDKSSKPRRKESCAEQNLLKPLRVQPDTGVGCTKNLYVQIDACIRDKEHISSIKTRKTNSKLKAEQNSNCARKFKANPLISCRICGKQIRQSYMEGHLNGHNDIRPYKCERGCDKTFKSLPSREHHHQYVHSSQQRCDICHKVYPSEGSLNSHKKYKHDEKKFSCSICDKTFTMSSHAKQHMKRNHPWEK